MMVSKLKKSKEILVRNKVAISPLLKKSGVHLSESPKATNRKSRNESKKELKSVYWL